MNSVRKIAIGVVAIVMLMGLGLAQAADKTFTGEIMDSSCASMGSHAGMQKGKDATDPAVKKECTEACVKNGAKYVLYNATRKMTYKLDDQQKPADLAGQKVKVTGTYDAATKTIHVTDITPAT
jgi:Protein of unknown function (DUF5818)